MASEARLTSDAVGIGMLGAGRTFGATGAIRLGRLKPLFKDDLAGDRWLSDDSRRFAMPETSPNSEASSSAASLFLRSATIPGEGSRARCILEGLAIWSDE